MRRLLVGVLLLGAADVAQAADMPFDIPILRGSEGPSIGPPTYYRWDGLYFGAQAGYNAASMDFGSSTSDLIGFILRNTALENEAQVSTWTVLPGTATSGNSFGAFFGYNLQWDNAVVGFELNYDSSNLRGAVTDTLARRVTTSLGDYDVTVTSSASFRLHDYVTARVRGGWSAGWIMPYMFGAVAVARVDVLRSATVDATQLADGAQLVETREDGRDGAFAYGYAAGLGADMMLIGGLFLRGEWEYLHLTYSGGYEASINTIRGGLGWKF